MGALHRQVGAHDRHKNLRRVGAAKRTSEKVRLRAEPRGDGCKGIARQELDFSQKRKIRNPKSGNSKPKQIQTLTKRKIPNQLISDFDFWISDFDSRLTSRKRAT